MKTITQYFLFIGFLALIIPGRALALDDGGGRSVFARGAGERALALGGTYVAIADDPLAIIWNPAGLASVERNAFYASNTNLIGMGFSERMGALALPSWKLGTFGLAFRRFGVDGIEQRDDRGTILNNNLSDAENELVLGYGRSLGTAWKFGVAVKFQQQNLAGYSDGALGLDMGLQVQPLRTLGLESDLAHNLNIGLSIRNLIEPSLRLDQENVPDPTGIRGGVALTIKLGSQVQLMTSADLDKTQNMDTRIHAGTELRLMDTLDMRAGSNNGMITAGAGVRYAGLTFDYTWEDNPLAAVHRFGLSMAFGQTTGEKRRQAATEREKAFQSRLVAMLEHQEKARNQELVAAARQALKQGDYRSALKKAATLRVLQPELPDIVDIEAAAYMEQGQALESTGDLSAAAMAFQRCLSLVPDHIKAQAALQATLKRSDREAARGTEIRQLLDTALADYADGHLFKARSGFLAILKLSPRDKDAAALLQATNQTLDLRTESLADQALAMATAGDFQAADRILEQAQKLVPNNVHLTRQQQKIRTLRHNATIDKQVATTAVEDGYSPDMGVPITSSHAQVTATKRVVPYADLPFKRQAELSRLYREGATALEDNRREDAVRYWEMVYANAPDYSQVASNLKQEYLTQGMEAFAAGKLTTATKIWEQALRIDPDDTRTKGYLARAYDHLARISSIKEDQ